MNQRAATLGHIYTRERCAPWRKDLAARHGLHPARRGTRKVVDEALRPTRRRLVRLQKYNQLILSLNVSSIQSCD